MKKGARCGVCHKRLLWVYQKIVGCNAGTGGVLWVHVVCAVAILWREHVLRSINEERIQKLQAEAAEAGNGRER